jgi:pimeloyl-ACP methyl ester carboxylesterase
MPLASAEPDNEGAEAAGHDPQVAAGRKLAGAPVPKRQLRVAAASDGSPPEALGELISRYDPRAFEVGRSRARIRLQGASPASFDVLLDGQRAKLVRADAHRPDALLEADPRTWATIAADLQAGMDAYRRGRLRIRRDLHLGVGFLAATAARSDGTLRFRTIRTARGRISISEAGSGPPALMIHGLGATKVSFLPTLAALAPHGRRAIAVDLPGFGDSDKPILGSYNARFFADAMTALLDVLELDRADVIGNSMGGRVALELGMSAPERVDRLLLLAPALAWLRSRPWAPFLRLVAPQLGLIQPAPRMIVEQIVRHVIPGSDTEWTSAGIDEFLRSYLVPAGRAAFYAAARNIYLEQPHGRDGFWTRLPSLQAESLFVWGLKDTLVPIRFERHVRDALPGSRHLELQCGHVPQLERPKETHQAILRFLADGRI